MAFTPDPNALSILLRNQPQIPQYGADEDLSAMIPEEELFQAQEAAGERGAASGGAYAIPSRESLRSSGIAALRKLFGIQSAEAQAKAYPARVTGEYGLARENVRSQGNIEAARARAEADAAREAQRQEFQQSQQQRGQEFQAGQGALNREALSGRASQAQGASRQNLEFTQGEINRRAQEKKPFNLLEYLFGGGTSPQPAAQGGSAVSDPSADLEPLRQDPRFANLPFQALVDQGIVTADSPEELAEYAAAWGR